MKRVELVLPKSLLPDFANACRNQMLECNVKSRSGLSSPGKQTVTVEVYRRTNKDVTIQQIFELGRVFENMTLINA